MTVGLLFLRLQPPKKTLKKTADKAATSEAIGSNEGEAFVPQFVSDTHCVCITLHDMIDLFDDYYYYIVLQM